MNLIAVFDTETTGLPLFGLPSEDKRQPHIVQLAAILYDLDAHIAVSSIDVIIKPTDWAIPEEAAKIHGISTERAMDVGISEALAVEMLLDLTKGRLRVAHNEQFDARMVRIACKRFFDQPVIDEWSSGRVECTARMSTKIINLPPSEKMKQSGMRHAKTPNLAEAYRWATGGAEIAGAHSAIGDTLACLQVYRALLHAAALQPVQSAA